MTGKINQLLVYWYLQQIYIAEKKGICLCYKKKDTACTKHCSRPSAVSCHCKT